MVDFTDAYYTGKDAFTVVTGFAGTLTKPEDVTNYKVSVQTSTIQDEWLTRLVVFQNFLLFNHLTAQDNVMIGLTRVKKTPKAPANFPAGSNSAWPLPGH